MQLFSADLAAGSDYWEINPVSCNIYRKKIILEPKQWQDFTCLLSVLGTERSRLGTPGVSHVNEDLLQLCVVHRHSMIL